MTMPHRPPKSRAEVCMEQQVPSIAAGLPDLFSWSGTALVTLPETRWPTRQGYSSCRHVPGTHLLVYSRSDLPGPRRLGEHPCERQLALPLEPSGNIIRFIPRSFSAFMSMRVLDFFARDRGLRAAASLLHAGGFLYLGDFTLASRETISDCLGRHADKLDRIESELADVGIFAAAKSGWWSRPRDYYA